MSTDDGRHLDVYEISDSVDWVKCENTNDGMKGE